MRMTAAQFPQRLRALRQRRRISQRVLSERCGLSKNMVSVYERGEAEPTAGVLEALADCFDVSVDYLLGRKDYF